MTRSIRILALLCMALALIVFPAFAQKEAKKEPWTGKLGDGRVITEEDMQRILDDHKKWLGANGKERTPYSTLHCCLRVILAGAWLCLYQGFQKHPPNRHLQHQEVRCMQTRICKTDEAHIKEDLGCSAISPT